MSRCQGLILLLWGRPGGIDTFYRQVCSPLPWILQVLGKTTSAFTLLKLSGAQKKCLGEKLGSEDEPGSAWGGNLGSDPVLRAPYTSSQILPHLLLKFFFCNTKAIAISLLPRTPLPAPNSRMGSFSLGENTNLFKILPCLFTSCHMELLPSPKTLSVYCAFALLSPPPGMPFSLLHWAHFQLFL